VRQDVTSVAGATTNVSAQIARVLDTVGFISSDYHVHMVNSPDSRVALRTRALSFAAEGVENVVATDHDAITDLTPTITANGLGSFLGSTIGEEITSFDYGHFNAYPQGEDPTRVSNGATDWGGAAPAGLDFPLWPHPLTPAQIEGGRAREAAERRARDGGADHHIGSRFSPLQIDSGVEPPQSFLPTRGVRLDPSVTNFFHPFKALELWNGNNNSHQASSPTSGSDLDEPAQPGPPGHRIADTVHTCATSTPRVRAPGRRRRRAPGGVVDAEIGRAVKTRRAVGGQGIYVQTRLVEGVDVADFTLGGATLVTDRARLVSRIRCRLHLGAHDRIGVYATRRRWSPG
jgi:hypothetical protein